MSIQLTEARVKISADKYWYGGVVKDIDFSGLLLEDES